MINMKKNICILLLTAIIAAMCFSLSGCYVSKPGKMSELVGTYELTSYTYRPKDLPDEEESENRISTRGITAYLVIKSDGTGYYAYRDNDTELWLKQVKIDYTYDDEEPDRIDRIRYNTGDAINSSDLPGTGAETLGLTFHRAKKSLNYSMPAILGRDYSTSVSYTKVSKSIDLSYVRNKMGMSTSFTAPYQMNGLDGVMYSERYTYGGDDYEYIYYIVDIHPISMKADVYYALKSDGLDVKKTGLAITLSEGSSSNEAILTIDGKRYSRLLGDKFSPYLTEVNTDGNYLDTLNKAYDADVADLISTAREYYSQQLQ